VQGSGHGLI